MMVTAQYDTLFVMQMQIADVCEQSAIRADPRGSASVNPESQARGTHSSYASFTSTRSAMDNNHANQGRSCPRLLHLPDDGDEDLDTFFRTACGLHATQRAAALTCCRTHVVVTVGDLRLIASQAAWLAELFPPVGIRSRVQTWWEAQEGAVASAAAAPGVGRSDLVPDAPDVTPNDSGRGERVTGAPAAANGGVLFGDETSAQEEDEGVDRNDDHQMKIFARDLFNRSYPFLENRLAKVHSHRGGINEEAPRSPPTAFALRHLARRHHPCDDPIFEPG
jgi:hypothetical protein